MATIRTCSSNKKEEAQSREASEGEKRELKWEGKCLTAKRWRDRKCPERMNE